MPVSTSVSNPAGQERASTPRGGNERGQMRILCVVSRGGAVTLSLPARRLIAADAASTFALPVEIPAIAGAGTRTRLARSDLGGGREDSATGTRRAALNV